MEFQNSGSRVIPSRGGGPVVCARRVTAMTTEEQPRRAGPSGPKKKLDVVDVPRSDAFGYLPYIGAAAAVIGLIAVVLRVPAYSTLAATVLLVGGALALGYLAWSDTHSLPPEEGFRHVVTASTVVVVLSMIAAAMITLHPPAPLGTVTLPRAGASGAIAVPTEAANLVLRVHGTFEADVGPSARAGYVLHLTRDGVEEEFEYTFERSAAESPTQGGNMAAAAGTEATSARHRLQKLHGAGRYQVTLDRMPDNLRPPMVASLHHERVTPTMVSALFGALAVLVLVVNLGLAKRGIEPTYAPALLVGLFTAWYLHRFFTGADLGAGLFAAVVVGFFVGGLGGELLARATRRVFL
jgi:hypothetical protein